MWALFRRRQRHLTVEFKIALRGVIAPLVERFRAVKAVTTCDLSSHRRHQMASVICRHTAEIDNYTVITASKTLCAVTSRFPYRGTSIASRDFISVAKRGSQMGGQGGDEVVNSITHSTELNTREVRRFPIPLNFSGFINNTLPTVNFCLISIRSNADKALKYTAPSTGLVIPRLMFEWKYNFLINS